MQGHSFELDSVLRIGAEPVMSMCLTYEELETIARPDAAAPCPRSLDHLAECETCLSALEEVRANLALWDELIQWNLHCLWPR